MPLRGRLPAWTIALAVAAILGGYLYWLNQPLVNAHAPHGLMSLQLASDIDGVSKIIGSWTPEQRTAARHSLYLDFLLILAYGFGMRGACLAAALMFSLGMRRLVTHVVAPLQVVAAGLDVLENAGQLAMLHGFSDQITWLGWACVPTALFAVLKWLFLFVGAATCLTGLAAAASTSPSALLGKTGGKDAVKFADVLHKELDGIDESRLAVGQSTPLPRAAGDALQRAEAAELAGLAFSGGGIRSATVCLGVLQALANASLLRRFDYLSTVSGGGYIGAWLAAWTHREPDGAAGVEATLKGQGTCAPQVEFLRTYSNYLTPRKGFFTVDTWAAIATYLRNLMLNLSMFVLLVWAALAFIVFFTRYGMKSPLPLGLAAVLLLWAAAAIATLGVTVRVTDLDRLQGVVRWAQTGAGVGFGIVATLFAAALTGGFWIIGWGLARFPAHPTLVWIGVAIGGAVVAWLTAWYCGEQVNLRDGSGAAAKSSGLAAPPPGAAPQWKDVMFYTVVVLVAASLAVASVAILVFAAASFNFDRWFSDNAELKAAVAMALSPAIVLSGVSVGIVFGIGLLGTKYSDKGREWWSRIIGWLLALTLGWSVLVGGAFMVPGLVAWAGEQPNLSANRILAGLWAALVFVLARVGKETSSGGALAQAKRALVTVGPYVAIAGFLVICTWSFFSLYTSALDCAAPTTLAACVRYGVAFWLQETESHGEGAALGAFVLCLQVALLLAWRVDINRFSLHDFYKNRLVRCYLGASNPGREKKVDQVSGFAESDQIPLQDLATVRPYPIVNTALNIVRGKRLAWQERRAASFIFTPRYCGFELPGSCIASFRETDLYAGGSVTLGTAMSISGAAVNPQHGKGTTPVFMLFATLLNLRTGVWMPNSRYPIARASPPIAGGYLLAELFGWTDEEKHYVHLSDGGHFDNLGVYELVRRRCRLIVAVDATEDWQRGFEDLGSCIRRCEVDFGARIHLNVSQLVPQANHLSNAAIARGTIDYAPLPGAAAFQGTILYLKSSRVHETEEAAALYSYGRMEARFPHHSTVDQWFDESRFESYRGLGRALGELLISRVNCIL